MEKYEKAKTKEKAALAAAQEAEMAAEAAGFQDEALNTAAASAIDNWRNEHLKASKAKKKTKVKPYNSNPSILS
jgi:hypothetical protein